MTDRRGLQLSGEQAEAVSRILDWWRTDRQRQVFRLHGYAGTGKTTVLQEVVRQIKASSPNARLHFAAPTGKAASVMRAKGLEGATTLHTNGLIWEGRISPRTGGFYFHPLVKGYARLDLIDLLIVDEASMVQADMVERILNHPPDLGQTA